MAINCLSLSVAASKQTAGQGKPMTWNRYRRFAVRSEEILLDGCRGIMH